VEDAEPILEITDESEWVEPLETQPEEQESLGDDEEDLPPL
jgi:hypothetical protein